MSVRRGGMSSVLLTMFLMALGCGSGGSGSPGSGANPAGGGGDQTQPASNEVAIRGFQILNTSYHANQHLNVSVRLEAAADHPDYNMEFVLFTAANGEEETAGVPVGGWHFPLVKAGLAEYAIELAIPGDIQPGRYVLSGHEYPSGEFVSSGTVYNVEPARGLPALEVVSSEAIQRALLVDAESTVDPSAPDLYRETPFSATVQIASRNYGATHVPITAHVNWKGREVPLRFWDSAQKQWVETLIIKGFEPNAPLSVHVELAMSETDAQRIRSELAGAPVSAPVTVVVNRDRSVPEAACEAAPGATSQCRHSAELDGRVYVAPARPGSEGMIRTIDAAGNPQPLTYSGQWSKSIGDNKASAGVDFSGWAQLSLSGFAGWAEGKLPVKVVGHSFNFARAFANGDAQLAKQAHFGLTVDIIGIHLYDKKWDSPTIDITLLAKEFPLIEKEIAYSDTVVVWIIPITYKLGARGSVGINGSVHLVSALATPKLAELSLKAGVQGDVAAFGDLAVGVPNFEAGVEASLSLVHATLANEAGGALTVQLNSANMPMTLTGSLFEKLQYKVELLKGDFSVFVKHPYVKWCKKCAWGVCIPYPCGTGIATESKSIAHWGGNSYGPTDLLNVSTNAFVIPFPGCVPTTPTCGNRCGSIANGCGQQLSCGGCPTGQTCGGSGTPNVCGVKPPPVCNPKLPEPDVASVLSRDLPMSPNTGYAFSVKNSAAFPNDLFASTSDYGPCGSNKSPSRSWVDVFTEDGKRVNAQPLCTLRSNNDLKNVVFASAKSLKPAAGKKVYVQIQDRACGLTYKSKLVPVVSVLAGVNDMPFEVSAAEPVEHASLQ